MRYEEREVSLSHLTSVDFFVSYWKVGPVEHTSRVLVLQQRAPPQHLHRNKARGGGASFAPIASLFKQFELIYVVGDAANIRRVRTNHRDEEVYLDRIKTSPK